MLSKLIYILFTISIVFNIYFAYDYYNEQQRKTDSENILNLLKIKNISQKNGSAFLFSKINAMHPKYNETKKYYFISIWNTLCKPCIKEMPLLDTLADNVNRNDFGYLFITENGNLMIQQFRQKHNLGSRNFIFLNDADTYISSVLHTLKLTHRQYPIQLIIDKKGGILFSQIGTLESSTDTTILKCIKNLNVH